MADLRELYQSVIIDHGKNPRNFHKLGHPSCCAEGYNPLCGDQLQLYLNLENNVVVDASFEGNGCAISQASASLMTEQLKGKTVTEVKELFAKVHLMLTENVADTESLGKIAVLSGVREFPARVKCATLAWHTLIAALNQQHEPVSTE